MDPPPFVIFESFGESAQVLTLYFWVELAPAVAAMRVARGVLDLLPPGLTTGKPQDVAEAIRLADTADHPASSIAPKYEKTPR